MKILMVSAEMAPFAKVGGLGDVAEALAAALARRGHDVRVVLPLYGQLNRQQEKIRLLKKLPNFPVRVGQRIHDVRFFQRGAANAQVKTYLIAAEGLFGRSGIYTDHGGQGFPDALARASLHSQAALMLPMLLDWPVDVVHCHDAEAVPALLYRRLWYGGRSVPGPGRTVLTIHNLAHQEIHPAARADDLGLPRAMVAFPGLLEFHGRLNLLKAGILAADRLNTVSPTYARETMAGPEFGMGLEGVLSSRRKRYHGILNGADYTTWNPGRDEFLVQTYTPKDHRGKERCRQDLLQRLGLAKDPAKPVCGLVGRMVQQKGLELVLPLLDRLVADGFVCVFLGTGEAKFEKALARASAKHPQNIAYVQDFDEPLAHRIYAGSDLFLMPSLFEPCGLSQMYALKYGTIPVVRCTGGLADTVIDARRSRGNGFVFDKTEPEALLAALRRAEVLWEDRDRWQALQDRAMACEFSWDDAAGRYEELYAEDMG